MLRKTSFVRNAPNQNWRENRLCDKDEENIGGTDSNQPNTGKKGVILLENAERLSTLLPIAAVNLQNISLDTFKGPKKSFALPCKRISQLVQEEASFNVWITESGTLLMLLRFL